MHDAKGNEILLTESLVTTEGQSQPLIFVQWEIWSVLKVVQDADFVELF